MRLSDWTVPKLWADAVVGLTTFTAQLRQILTNGITLREHVAGEVKTVRWVGETAPLKVSTALVAPPLFVFAVASITATKGASTRTGPLTVSWSWDGKSTITVLAIDTLTGPTAYDVTLWIQGG